MKKKIKFSVLLIAMIISLINCKKDENPQKKCVLFKTITHSENRDANPIVTTAYSTVYLYNSSYNLVQINTYYDTVGTLAHTTKLIYDNLNQIKKIELYNESGYLTDSSIYLYQDNYVFRSNNYSSYAHNSGIDWLLDNYVLYTYDLDQKMLSSDTTFSLIEGTYQAASFRKYEYSDGNCIRAMYFDRTFSYHYQPSEYTCYSILEFEYNDKLFPNDMNLLFLIPSPTRKNYIIKEIMKNGDGQIESDEDIINYVHEYNELGYPTLTTVTFGNKTRKINYYYEFY